MGEGAKVKKSGGEDLSLSPNMNTNSLAFHSQDRDKQAVASPQKTRTAALVLLLPKNETLITEGQKS